MVLWFMIMAEFIKANGKMILNMEKAFKNFPTNVCIKEIISMENLRVLGDIAGQMANSMKDSG